MYVWGLLVCCGGGCGFFPLYNLTVMHLCTCICMIFVLVLLFLVGGF